MSAFRLYHNPRCSKSRQTLALLAEHNINVTPILYLQEGLTEIQILTLQKKLKLSSLLSMMRPKEQEFVAQGLSKTSDEASLLRGLLAAPKLLERPILETEDAAAVGRPPEQVLALIKQG
jgi:arsenate reductase